MARLLLKSRGWEMIPAQDGRQVLEKHRGEAPDLILMDLQMPGQDGMQATRAIREREAGGDRHVPIVWLTAHVRSEVRDGCLDAGMDDVLSKPIDMERLQALILGYLGR